MDMCPQAHVVPGDAGGYKPDRAPVFSFIQREHLCMCYLLGLEPRLGGELPRHI